MKPSRTLHAALFLLSIALAVPPCPQAAENAGTLSLSLRKRVETQPGSGRFHTLVQPAKWDAKKTAIIVCDMWDSHHCLNAVRRVGEMAPRMNHLLNAARRHGVLIIHAPSGCMDAYKNHPARQNAVKTPRAKHLPKDIGRWCYRIPTEEKGVYPIDQSDPEDDDPAEHRDWEAKLQKMGRNPRSPWKTQTDILKIENSDIISDKGEEIWSVLEERGIDNVILLGVHTNMCVLGRPFGLRQMAKNGKNVVLMRDLTDTMYNPARAPFVSHFTGTDLIVEHIEKWVSPSITSDQILGGKPFRFSGDKRPHLVLILAEGEYQTNRTLPEFALKHLGKDFRVSTVFGSETDAHDLPGLDVLNEADVALISVRRRALPTKQMDIIHKFVDGGKPLIGIRTASHAFSLRGKKPPEGCAVWETFDPDVWGGHYSDHYRDGPKVEVKTADGAAAHPILSGINVAQLHSNGSLYKVRPLAKSATPLLIGSIPDKPAEPILWTHATKAGGRVVYTSLGHPDDFKEAAFSRLLSNAIHWAAGLPVGATKSSGESAQPAKALPAPDGKAEQPRDAGQITLREAVEELNRKIDKGYFDTVILRQPPLGKDRWPKGVTVAEVVSAIRGWDRKKVPVADSTYRIFQQIADSKTLPPRASLYFRDQWEHPGGKDKYEYRVWRIQLDVMTGKNTGYGFAVRKERLDRRIALLPAPGYSWLENPLPAKPGRGYSTGFFVVAFDDAKDAAFLITVAWTRKGVRDLRVIAFDSDGNRYLPARQRWGGAASDLVMLRFRLDPKKLPAAQVEYVGIEGITQENLKYASEAAVKRAREKSIEVLPLPEVGKPYEFSVTTNDGETIESRKLRSKVVLIDCWASWCGPCLREMPEVKKVYEKWHDKGLEVIGLSFDKNPKAAAAAAKKYAITWPHVVVPAGEEARELWTQAARIESIPRLLVVDQKGVLCADLSSARDLEKIIAGLLAESLPTR